MKLWFAMNKSRFVGPKKNLQVDRDPEDYCNKCEEHWDKHLTGNLDCPPGSMAEPYDKGE